MPFFSVIIPTYNRADLLRESLASLFAQRFTGFEALVVDDGSTDETPALLRSLGNRVRSFRQHNQGPGAARNLGLRQAQGAYVAFLDSDDQWFPWTLELFRRVIEREGSPFIMAGFGALPNDHWENGPNALDKMTTQRYSNMLAACSGRTPPVGGTPSICVQREALLQTGGFATGRMNGEDTDLWLRLGACPGFVRILAPPVFRQRFHAGSITRQMEPAVAGAWHLLQQERNHAYPGGRGYSRSRRRIICGTIRSVSRECLSHRLADEGFRLYWATWGWNLALGNWKYLFGFPLAALRHRGRRV